MIAPAHNGSPANEVCAGATPFELLLDMDRKSRRQAPGLPIEEEPVEEWVGVAFALRGKTLLASMTEVVEVVMCPQVAVVPGVKPWVLGIANLRGALLPIMDLQGFLFGEPAKNDPSNQRILVIDQRVLAVGLLVDAVFGAKHFWVDERTDEPPTMETELAPYIEFAYRRGDQDYGIFNLARLAQSELFLDVAL